jgi:hypothetical protein
MGEEGGNLCPTSPLMDRIRRFLDALASELQTEGLLESPYPVVGHVTTTPDPSEPNVEFLRCTEGRSDDPQETGCVLLNQAGDFARVMPPDCRTTRWPSVERSGQRVVIATRIWRPEASVHVGGWRFSGNPEFVSRQEHPAWPRCFLRASNHLDRFNFAHRM